LAISTPILLCFPIGSLVGPILPEQQTVRRLGVITFVTTQLEALVNNHYLGYTVKDLISVGRWTPWNNLISPSVKSVSLETWCPYLILAVKGQLFITKPGFVPILIAASTSKSGMAMFILTNPLWTERSTLPAPAKILVVYPEAVDYGW